MIPLASRAIVVRVVKYSLLLADGGRFHAPLTLFGLQWVLRQSHLHCKLDKSSTSFCSGHVVTGWDHDFDVLLIFCYYYNYLHQILCTNVRQPYMGSKSCCTKSNLLRHDLGAALSDCVGVCCIFFIVRAGGTFSLNKTVLLTKFPPASSRQTNFFL